MSETEEEDKIKAFGEKVAAHMEAQWKLDVFDPPIGSSHPRAKFCLDVISKIIERNGWGWALPYRGDGPPQWCGMAAGDAYAEAGLDPSWLATYFASTYRLMLWATYQRYDSQRGKQNPKPPLSATPSMDDRRRYVNVQRAQALTHVITPQRGDILIVGDGNPQWGDHVTVVVGYDEASKTFDTISGNGGGAGPRGNHRQGISRKSYRLGARGYAPMFLIRAASHDLP